MRRFCNDWIDRASMRTIWLAAKQNPATLTSMITSCNCTLLRLDEILEHTRRLFSKLATQESLVFKAMRRGRKYFRLSGRLLLLREALTELYRRRRHLHDRLADVQRRQDCLIKHAEELSEVLFPCENLSPALQN